jgi:hypothetical protein
MRARKPKISKKCEQEPKRAQKSAYAPDEVPHQRVSQDAGGGTRNRGELAYEEQHHRAHTDTQDCSTQVGQEARRLHRESVCFICELFCKVH